MRILDELILCLIILGPFVARVASSWWYFSQIDPISSSRRLTCEMLPHLNKQQRKICSRHPELVKILGEGVRLGVSECQHQFRYKRWNCSIFMNDATLFGKSLVRGGTKEIAFLQAMTSAASAYALAKACSRGHPRCGCTSAIPNGKLSKSNSFESQFEWDGCDHVVRFSTSFVRRFVDASEIRARDGKAKFTLHNNRVGRIIIRKNMKRICRCHGVSGSCASKTCWTTLPSFREIGDALRDKFDGAVKITFKPSGRVIPAHQYLRKPTMHNLIYYEPSPDFCTVNYAKGSVGTRHRLCLGNSEGEESCDILCCRQKYETIKLHYSHPCQCNFTWCCQVECKTCNSTRVEYRCK